jgi:hypothetical protein
LFDGLSCRPSARLSRLDGRMDEVSIGRTRRRSHREVQSRRTLAMLGASPAGFPNRSDPRRSAHVSSSPDPALGGQRGQRAMDPALLQFKRVDLSSLARPVAGWRRTQALRGPLSRCEVI